MEEEELRRQEAAAKDQADAGSPGEETGKIYLLLDIPEIMTFMTEKDIKYNPSKLFIILEIIKQKQSFHFFLHAA